MIRTCLGCGAEKDDAVLEVYPYPESAFPSARPLPPLFELDCEGRDAHAGAWKRVTVCHHCLEKLDPDMWISSRCWAGIDPVTPFEALPDLPPPRP